MALVAPRLRHTTNGSLIRAYQPRSRAIAAPDSVLSLTLALPSTAGFRSPSFIFDSTHSQPPPIDVLCRYVDSVEPGCTRACRCRSLSSLPSTASSYSSKRASRCGPASTIPPRKQKDCRSSQSQSCFLRARSTHTVALVRFRFEIQCVGLAQGASYRRIRRRSQILDLATNR